MIATPTDYVDVLGGTTTNAYGDEIDADTVVPGLENLPASIIEQRQRPHQPKDSEDRIVRYFKGRMQRGLPIVKGNRLRSRTTGAIYVVENLYQQSNPFWSQDLSFDLSLTT